MTANIRAYRRNRFWWGGAVLMLLPSPGDRAARSQERPTIVKTEATNFAGKAGGEMGADTDSSARTLEGHTASVMALVFSSDGKLLAGSSNDTTVRLWDTTTWKTVRTLQGHTAEVDSVDFAPDGQTVASGSKDKAIKLWDAKTGKLLRTLTGHTGRVESLAFAPDGKTLVTGGGGGDSAIKLWDLTKE